MDKWRNHYYAAQDIGFYFASSDRELIEKVSSIMKRNGHLSFSDSMGREHYLLDGRSGAPVLTRNIDTVTKRLTDKNKDEYEHLRPYFSKAIDEVMEISGIPMHLKGYRYIKFMLYRIIEDDSLLSPLCKTLYPSICELYHCTNFQIERDIRYAITKSTNIIVRSSPKAFVCALLDRATTIACELECGMQDSYLSSKDEETGNNYNTKSSLARDKMLLYGSKRINNNNENLKADELQEKQSDVKVVHRKTYPMNIDYSRFSYLTDN